MQKIQAYVISIITMLALLYIPNATTMQSVNSAWYTCIKPTITPPKFVFPIVWTLLYIFIAIALAETLIAKPSNNRSLLLFFHIWNLVLNVAWSLVYFGNHDAVLALFIIFNMIIATIFILYYTTLVLPLWVFWLLLPYLGWLYFACLLNFLSTLKKC
jgi:benzodiazapine receptor